MTITCKIYGICYFPLTFSFIILEKHWTPAFKFWIHNATYIVLNRLFLLLGEFSKAYEQVLSLLEWVSLPPSVSIQLSSLFLYKSIGEDKEISLYLSLLSHPVIGSKEDEYKLIIYPLLNANFGKCSVCSYL